MAHGRSGWHEDNQLSRYADHRVTRHAGEGGDDPREAGDGGWRAARAAGGEAYALTSDDLLHAAHLARGGGKDRATFFAKPQACLRASPLVKQFGWGVHHDGEGRIALVAMESEDYARLLADPAVKKTPGMRRSR